MAPDFDDKLIASYPRSARWPEEHACPRGVESGRDGRAVWENDDSCSYCGSLHPELFMERVEAGNVTLTPTDKNYKVYVSAQDGSDNFKQTYRGDGDPGGDDPTKWVWTTRQIREHKFYFQHLSEDQRKRFVELMNRKRLLLEYPGYFYTLPFFMTREAKRNCPHA